METEHVAAILRALSEMPSRRGLLRVIAGVAMAGSFAARPGGGEVAAKHKHKHKHHKPKPPACTPACAGKACGADGCRGSCGTCPGDQVCDHQQHCCTPEGQQATCGTKGCGDKANNCGQSVACGGCAEGEDCVSGVCTDACDGQCPGEKVCVGGRCTCPAAKPIACPLHNGVCSADLDVDAHCCAANGINGHYSPCAQGQICCQGVCTGGCASGFGSCVGTLCPGNDCNPCPASAPLCCNAGPPSFGTSCRALAVCP